jgi:uncharacterized membrane protein YbaN (DUF454 family)
MAWRVLAAAALGLGLVGLALPIVPQVPFLLVAASAAAKGWPALDRRLRSNPTYGPLVSGWCERRALPTRVKAATTIGLVGTLACALFLPLWAALTVTALALGSLLWIWSLPSD